MIDISKQTVKIDCPKCNGSVSVTIQQVADEVLVKCSCGQGIRLQDSNGTSKKAIIELNETFKSLENTFKNFGK